MATPTITAERAVFTTPMKLVVLIAIAAATAANGVWMLAEPAGWYAIVPGAEQSGPFNRHFVGDVGAAYLTLALAFALIAYRPRHALVLLAVAGCFTGLHGAIHLADVFAGRLAPVHLLIDLPGVYLPVLLIAALAVWLKPEWRQDRDASRVLGDLP